MPTKARTVISGICCHVTQRGNYRQPTFFCDEDRELYLDLVSRRAVESQLQLLGWCLMSNHVHWIVCPQHPEALARTFRRAHSEYSQYVNRKHQRASGHLWQNRFYSCLLGDDHLWRALRYVECNPVRALSWQTSLPSITGHRRRFTQAWRQRRPGWKWSDGVIGLQPTSGE